MGCLFTKDPEVESSDHSETAQEFYQQKPGLRPSGDHRIKEEVAFCFPKFLYPFLYLEGSSIPHYLKAPRVEHIYPMNRDTMLNLQNSFDMVDPNDGILQRVNFDIGELSDSGWVSVLVPPAGLCPHSSACKNCAFTFVYVFVSENRYSTEPKAKDVSARLHCSLSSAVYF